MAEETPADFLIFYFLVLKVFHELKTDAFAVELEIFEGLQLTAGCIIGLTIAIFIYFQTITETVCPNMDTNIHNEVI